LVACLNSDSATFAFALVAPTSSSRRNAFIKVLVSIGFPVRGFSSWRGPRPALGQ
jgi:hypothetical protein